MIDIEIGAGNRLHTRILMKLLNLVLVIKLNQSLRLYSVIVDGTEGKFLLVMASTNLRTVLKA